MPFLHYKHSHLLDVCSGKLDFAPVMQDGFALEHRADDFVLFYICSFQITTFRAKTILLSASFLYYDRIHYLVVKFIKIFIQPSNNVLMSHFMLFTEAPF